ncbi:MAG TPA: DUF1116 domain-containing protein [Thermoleophilaceae bacterium]|nr:DUF1116 domain-containing protein [Thermoleophilaceae bacterium]
MSVTTSLQRERANQVALERLTEADPVLVDMRPASEVVPGMTPETILTSGAPMPWAEYTGGQRAAVIGGALFEGLAADADEADAKLRDGAIRLGACHDHGCVGSLAGIYTASMPVFVVENRAHGNVSFCNSFEGSSPKRLNYGVYDEEVHETLLFLQDVAAPVLAEAIQGVDGGIPLRPIIRRALNMGDELHSRNAAATLLFTRELLTPLLEVSARRPEETRRTVEFMVDNDYFFLRLSMAASKATADAARDIEGSSVVTAMTFSCRAFSIRVSGLGDEWFSCGLPGVDAKLSDGYTEDDIEFMGGESIINETVGLGGFAQAAAFPLQDYQGGSPEGMIANTERMYGITVGEHPMYRIPALSFRGTPIGIDVLRVVESGVLPVMDIGVAGRDGGQIGAGLMTAPLPCFEAAAEAYAERYGE